MLLDMLWLCALHLQILINKHAQSRLPRPAATYLPGRRLMLNSLCRRRAVAQRVALGSGGILGVAEPSTRGSGRTLFNAKGVETSELPMKFSC